MLVRAFRSYCEADLIFERMKSGDGVRKSAVV